jgi:hypothetical protein
MKFKKQSGNHLSTRTPKQDKTIIGEEYDVPEITTFICNYCNRDLIKLSDSSGNNISWYCNNCSIPFEPENESIRHKQKLEVPERNVEPAAVSFSNTPDVSIMHNPPIRGGFAELQKKGLKIKDYHTTEKE